jgi:predicted phosphodiesterase
MKVLRSPLKKTIQRIGLILSLFLFLLPFTLDAASIREVSQNIEGAKVIQLPFQFAVLGDSRDGKRVYTQLIQKILERKPHFIIHLGDMISKPNEKEWKEFFEISKTINIPFFPVIGNHEVADTTRGEEIYRKQFVLPDGKTYYAFQAGGAFFVILDSEKKKGKIVDEQEAWVETTLSSSNEKFKFVFIHRPLFLPMDSFKTGKAMDKYPIERDRLHQLFMKTGVKTVFAGDDHRYDRTEKSNILYIITGGGGAPIYTFKDSGGYFHYVWVSVERGKMEGEVVDLDGQIQDRFVIE